MCVFSVRLLPDLIHSAQPASRPRLYRPPQIPQCPQHEPFGVGEREKEHRVSARDCSKGPKRWPTDLWFEGWRRQHVCVCSLRSARARGGRGTVYCGLAVRAPQDRRPWYRGRPCGPACNGESHTSGDTVCPRPQTSLRLPRYGPPAASGAYRVRARLLPCADVVVLPLCSDLNMQPETERQWQRKRERERPAGCVAPVTAARLSPLRIRYCTYAYNTILDRRCNALCSWVLQ